MNKKLVAKLAALVAAVALVPTLGSSAVIFTARVDSPANPFGATGNYNRLTFVRTTSNTDRYQLVARHFPILASGQLGTEVNPNEQYTRTPGAVTNTEIAVWGADHNEWVGAVLRDDLAGRAVDVNWSVTQNL